MDTSNTTGWWNCLGCSVEVELPVTATSGFQVPCPDCGEAMTEQWQWDAAA
ncbi:hypothetical protein [Pseudonocardia xinjiangensis]|uniref:Small CPxCG-related zinc finger protein n=1 Tax=Pseudonocardia xinjiangensis TaxID=75289 RepID=A0ABX1R9Q7_9PSEU|nr:hypothetical protein [Pseudonocardia xinjiangensis]NMH77115.1 hypothetical protein [Pseudonocardia xinjiangensis]